MDSNSMPLWKKGEKVPFVFDTPFTPEEIQALQKEWGPVVEYTMNSMIESIGWRPENSPAMEMTVFMSRVLATINHHHP